MLQQVVMVGPQIIYLCGGTKSFDYLMLCLAKHLSNPEKSVSIQLHHYTPKTAHHYLVRSHPAIGISHPLRTKFPN